MFVALIAALCMGASVQGFAPSLHPVQSSSLPVSAARFNTIQRRLAPADISEIIPQDMKTDRIVFWLSTFAATGSAAVGRSVIPITWTKYWETQALGGTGAKSLGGTDMELFGYPEPVYSNDVEKILSDLRNMTIPTIVSDYPIENQIEGYLRFESLIKAMPDTNPTAVRAVFDSMALGINKNQIAPRVAQARLQSYEEDISRMKEEMNKGKALGFLALFLLLGILGTADAVAVYHLHTGWFPCWPGLDHLPGSLFEHLTDIPSYWMSDVPEAAPSNAFPMN